MGDFDDYLEYTLIAVETFAEEDAHDDDVAQGVTA